MPSCLDWLNRKKNETTTSDRISFWIQCETDLEASNDNGRGTDEIPSLSGDEHLMLEQNQADEIKGARGSCTADNFKSLRKCPVLACLNILTLVYSKLVYLIKIEFVASGVCIEAPHIYDLRYTIVRLTGCGSNHPAHTLVRTVMFILVWFHKGDKISVDKYDIIIRIPVVGC